MLEIWSFAHAINNNNNEMYLHGEHYCRKPINLYVRVEEGGGGGNLPLQLLRVYCTEISDIHCLTGRGTVYVCANHQLINI